MQTPTIIADLKARGLLFQSTNEAELTEHLATGSRTLYCGFDPTADSLHIGSLVPLLTLKRFQAMGHRPIVLVGGATGLIGDPSFKAQERQLNTADVVSGWVAKLQKQTSRFVDFSGKNAALMANNADWTEKMDVLTFLRDIGKHFSVNAMIARDAVKSRLERADSGISYTEFSYALLQAMDFAELNKLHSCTLQIGGSDQWGNIVAGVDLTRRLNDTQVHALTLPLVTKADGTKFGKTETGTIWLDASKTSPYAFYQFWLNTADADVENFLKYFTFLSLEEISNIVKYHTSNASERLAQKTLAREVTVLVHGEDACEGAERISLALFGDLNKATLKEDDFKQIAIDGLPTISLSKKGDIWGNRSVFDEASDTSYRDSITRAVCQFKSSEHVQYLMDQSIISAPGKTTLYYLDSKPNLESILILFGELATSKRQAREFIANNAVQVNGHIQTDPTYELTNKNAFFEKYHLIKRGKKNFALLVLED